MNTAATRSCEPMDALGVTSLQAPCVSRTETWTFTTAEGYRLWPRAGAGATGAVVTVARERRFTTPAAMSVAVAIASAPRARPFLQRGASIHVARARSATGATNAMMR